MPRCPGGVTGPASVPQQQPPSLMPLLVYVNYAMDSPQVGFFFRVESPIILYITCLVSILVSVFYFQVPSWMPYSPKGAQPLGFVPLQPFGVYPWQAYVGPHLVCIEWLLPPLPQVRGAFCYSVSCSPTIPSIWWGIQPWGLSRESPNPSTFPT